MSYGGYLLETLFTLVAVCAAAFAVLYGARRLGIGRASGPISLAGQLPLDAHGRRAIYLVRVGEQVLVVGASEGGLTKLGEIPASELPARADEPTPAFAKVLARALSKEKA
jgi:flagellar biogenesis protein FliO